MGRKQLRSGDLVTSKAIDPSLWKHCSGNMDSSDIVVVKFKFGTLLGCAHVHDPEGHRLGAVRALVLDSATGRLGWCDIRYIKRAD